MMRIMVVALLLVAMFGGAAAAVAQDHFQAGIAALQKGDLAAAQSNLESATRQHPEDARAWLFLAQTYAKLKNQGSALDAARKAESLAPENAEILQALANLYAGPISDPAKAASLGARYAERKPDDTTAWRRLAAFCLATGQPDRAIEAANKGLAADNSAALHSLLAQAYVERKQLPQAASELAAAVRLNPYDEDLHFRLGQVYLLQNDPVSAATVLENARKYFDKSPQIELALGVAHYAQRDFPKAVDEFLKTIRLAPDVPQPYIFLGRILEHAHDRLPEVAARFAEYQSRNPKDPLGYVLQAKALIARLSPASTPEVTQSAAALLEHALSLKEADSDAHYLMGLVLERQAKFSEAATHLERSIALNPGDPAAHYRLARVYAQLGRKQDSERERALHEKLSNDVNTPDPRGIVNVQPKSRP